MNDQQQQFLDRAAAAAILANHPFPVMAACEAALESGWGNSGLARTANNLFGMKQHAHPIYKTLSLPTKEDLGGEWKEVSANWVLYPDLQSCFADRVATLERLAPDYPHYQAALDAADPDTYITEVSKSWSTDPDRPSKVSRIYQRYLAEGDHAS